MMHSLICLASFVMYQSDYTYTPEEEVPIAYFDVVSQQEVTGIFDMGVIAYHLEGVDRVEYTINRAGYVGDWNNDEIVDGGDLGVLIERWGKGVDGKELGELLGAWGQQIPHKPEVITVTEQTLNERTGQEEYWFSLDTRKDPDTKITVTAEIFPVDGPSLVLDHNMEDFLGVGYGDRPQYVGVNLFSNNTGYWTGPTLYMSPDGDDATADGTMEKPFANFGAALRYSVGHDDPYMEVGGTRFYLLAGEYELDWSAFCSENWWSCSVVQGSNRFVEVSPAPGLEKGDVVLGTVPGGQLGFARQPVHFKDIVFQSAEENWMSSTQTMRWYDNCTISGDPDEWWNANYVKSTSASAGWQYYTDCLQQYQAEGNAGILMRNIHMDHIQCDMLEMHWIQMALNVLMTNHNANYPNVGGCHVDYIQINGGFETHRNIIFRDIFGNHSCMEQGVHACPGSNGVEDIAWVNVELSNTGGLDLERCNISALIFRWCGPGKNNLFKNCMFHGKQDLQDGNNHSMASIDIYNEDGTQNTEGPWAVREDGQYGGQRFKNVKFEDCWNDWDRTIPLFLKPDASPPWAFYGPDELQFDSDTRDGLNDNPFGPDDPWLSQITGIIYTQTK